MRGATARAPRTRPSAALRSLDIRLGRARPVGRAAQVGRVSCLILAVTLIFPAVSPPSSGPSLKQSLRPSLKQSLIPSLMQSLMPSLMQSLMPSLMPSLTAQTLDEARQALRTGDYEGSMDGFRSLLGGAPLAAKAGLAEALAEVGRYGDAEEMLRMDGTTPPQLLNALGEALRAQGRIREAEAAFRSAIDAGMGNLRSAELNLAVLLFERGEVEEAMRRFDAFIDVYNGSARLNAEELLAVGTAVQYLGRDDPALFLDALKAYDEASAADPASLEPALRTAELFLEKYNSREAHTALSEVLAVNAANPRALLGLARALHFDGQSSEALQRTEQALEVNPNLVAARVLRARIFVASSRHQAAEEEIDRALAVNPNSLPALTTRAAMRFLEGEQGVFEATRDRIFELNPRYADVYTRTAELSVQRRKYREATELAAQAITLDPSAWEAYGILGVNQLRLGEVDSGRTSLETAFAGDPYNPWFKNTLDLLDTYVRYDEVEAGPFLFMLDRRESELLELYMADLGQEALTTMSARYGYTPEAPVRVEAFKSHADFSVRTVGLAGIGGLLGVSFGNVVAMDSPSARDPGEFNWGSTLWHELAHVIHLGMTSHEVPRWLSEGLAVFEERRARPGWGADIGLSFLRAVNEELILPVSRLDDGFMRPSYPEQVIHSYFQASLVADMITEERGFEPIAAILRAYGRGLQTPDVFRTVLGVEPEDFDEQFDDWLHERYADRLEAVGGHPTGVTGVEGVVVGNSGPMPVRPSRADIELAASSRPGDFGSQLALGRLLFRDGDRERATRYLERARELFPEYAAADSPHWYLAQIRREKGDLRGAAGSLTILTRINENHYSANLELADVLEELGDRAGAAEALNRAIYIYPYDLSVHTRLAGLAAGLGDHARAVRERRAVVALNPVDMAEALYQLAESLVDSGDARSARREVLRALEIAPSFAAAQDLLLRLVGTEGSDA